MATAACLDWLDTSPPEELSALREWLARRVVGQDLAIEQIVRALARHRAGLAGWDRPVASFLLLGPTGVGKTLTVEALAEALHGSPRALLKIHCAEFRSDHELARMKGSPPGYVGWRECVPLFHESRLKEVRLKSELALMLFDEVEKAHPALWDLLLGLLDKGEVILNDNSRVDFRKTLIFLTGNAGSRDMAEALAGGMGFQPHTRGDMAGIATRASERLFSPEFRNRLTATLTYQTLRWQDLIRICRLELGRMAARVAAASSRDSRAVALEFEPGAVEQIARAGYGPISQKYFQSGCGTQFPSTFGARHIGRAIESLVEDPLANLLASGRVLPRDVVTVCAGDPAGSSPGTRPAPLRFRKNST